MYIISSSDKKSRHFNTIYPRIYILFPFPLKVSEYFIRTVIDKNAIRITKSN